MIRFVHNDAISVGLNSGRFWIPELQGFLMIGRVIPLKAMSKLLQICFLDARSGFHTTTLFGV